VATKKRRSPIAQDNTATPGDGTSPERSSQKVGLAIESRTGPGILHEITGVIARYQGSISSIEIIESPHKITDHVYFEIDLPGDPAPMMGDLQKLRVVRTVKQIDTMQKIFGKRIIIVGGGAQVGQVAMGAILEADRHNIRGEHISIDTIPLVGEQPLAAAVRAAARLPRVKAIVMAGSLMGGEIEKAVREVRAEGLLVVSLNMAGSVPEAADLIVTDPVQAGVMTVMAVSDTAKFSVARLKRRIF